MQADSLPSEPPGTPIYKLVTPKFVSLVLLTELENWHADPVREGEGKPIWDRSFETLALPCVK